jgi:hypothetical protein
MGEAKRNRLLGPDPAEKIPKTFLWSRDFVAVFTHEHQQIVLAARRASFPPPSEDTFAQAVLRAGFVKMKADMEAMREQRAALVGEATPPSV